MAAPLILLAIVIVFGPWVLFIVSAVRRRAEKQEQDLRWEENSRRLRFLEDEIQKLRLSPNPLPEPEPVFEEAVVLAPELPSEPPALPPVLPHVPPVAAPVTRTPWTERLRGGLDLEEALGANWLNKIGVIVLVFGIAFFLVYQLRQVGPAGKVFTGFAVSAALLGGGVFLETRSRYRVFAYGAIGGGWALGFFTTYAMYHVDAARILTSQTPDLVLMLLVAAAMTIHTLRYRSQAVTGLAFLLAFSTLTISQVTVYSLSAGIVLTLGLVAVAARMQWFELELAGIAVAYLNHWLLLRRIIQPMGAHSMNFPSSC